MKFPQKRPRRLRLNKTMRHWVREHSISPVDLVLPIFVKEGLGKKKEILSMPGVYQHTANSALREAQEAYDLGISAVILFGIPKHKDAQASGAHQANAVIQKLTTKLKKSLPDLLVICDVCLCEYSSHGHCGHLTPKGSVDNDSTLKTLSKIALSLARSGADIVAPSDMMDGRISHIRQTLDKYKFQNTAILSYAVKHASAFYGPFRDAAENAPQKGDRKTYQMDPANAREAIVEARMDEEEGADFILVKPGLPCLDLIKNVRENVSCPVGAYSVSGEYAMIKAAAQNGWLNEKEATLESLIAFKRAGSDFIIHYG
ncbi:MAG: porphobilinogen synthase, partial [Candidatus Omnitrophota bacterium]